MEDIGDILFYLIAAIIGIAGAIANKRKKDAEKKASQSVPGGQGEETTFPDLEEEFDIPEAEPEVAGTRYEMIDEESLATRNAGFGDLSFETSEEQALKMAAEYEGNYSEPMADDFASEGKSVLKTSITDNELGIASEIPMSEKSSRARVLIRDFDLPKAIVYSEILARKDFV